MRRVLVACLVALSCLVPTVAAADDATAWTVAAGDDGTGRPNFAYEAEPGQVIEDTWVVGNAGTEPISLEVYAADAFTTSSGQLDVAPGADQPVGVGAWVEPSATHVELQPGQSETVSFTLVVPADAPPGDHAGAIVSSLQPRGAGTFAIERRLATRIHVRVPGEVTTSWTSSGIQVAAPAAVNPFAPVQVEVAHRVTNDGTGRSFGSATVTVAGPGGLGGASTSGQVDEILPGSTVDRLVTLPVWALGPTTVTVDLRPEGIDGTLAQPVTVEATLWLVPWGWVGVLVLAVAAGVVVGLVRQRNRYEWVDAEQEPITPAAASSVLHPSD